MPRPSLSTIFTFCVLAATASAADSSDCLSEYQNALANGNTSPFCNRCHDETGANPLRNRCSLCQLKCPGTSDQTVCALNGAESADDLLNSLVFIWAAVERCDQNGNAVQCSVDVNSAIESVNHMINVILKAVQKCGGVLQGAHAKCGMAVSELTESLAGIAAKSSGIVEHCPNDFRPNETLVPQAQGFGNMVVVRHKFAHCFVDMKSLIKSVIKASMRLYTLKGNCKDNPQGNGCARNILQVVGAFAEMGEYIAGTVGHCSEPSNKDAGCASEILGLLRVLDRLGAAGMALSQDCRSIGVERLYLESGEDDVEAGTGSGLMMAGMAALVPVAAVLSFVMGRRIGMATSSRAIAQDAESQEMLQASEQ